jgi:hypothetical protein
MLGFGTAKLEFFRGVVSPEPDYPRLKKIPRPPVLRPCMIQIVTDYLLFVKKAGLLVTKRLLSSKKDLPE